MEWWRLKAALGYLVRGRMKAALYWAMGWWPQPIGLMPSEWFDKCEWDWAEEPRTSGSSQHPTSGPA